MGQIGEILKTAREKKGITISQAEEDTKIRAKYLIALENESFDEIPGRVYVKGFLSNYASYLGLDSMEMVQVLREMLPVGETKEDNTLIKEKKVKRKYKFRPKFFHYAIGILAIITLIGLNYLWQHNKNDTAKPNKSTVASAEKTESNNSKANKVDQQIQQDNVKQAEQQKPAEQKNQAGVHLVLNADKGVSWISVNVDGKVAFEGNINQGETKSFDGNSKVVIRFGSAGAVNITANGNNVGYVGSIGQVVDKEFLPNSNN